MGVKLVLALRDGWKSEENKRFGRVLEMRFVDTVAGKILFRYAACLEDRGVWIDYFDKLRMYDEKVTDLRSMMTLIDPDSVPPPVCGVVQDGTGGS